MKEISFYFNKQSKNLQKILKTLNLSISKSLGIKNIVVVVGETKKPTTNPMLKYYWGVIVKMVLQRIIELGNTMYTAELVHDLLREKTGFCEIIVIETPEGAITQMKLNSIAFSARNRVETLQYFDNCREFALDFFGIEIPLPDLQGYTDNPQQY